MGDDRLTPLLRRPLVVAPMAGGPTTPELVAAAAASGALGILAAGYQTVEAMVASIVGTRALTPGPFGVNLFVPGSPTDRPEAVRRYVDSLVADAARVGTRPAAPEWDDDGWHGKLDALLAGPPAVVSFTFGCPGPEIVDALRGAGASVVVTVTSPAEAEVAADAGADALCVQGPEAGGHRGTFENVGEPDDAPDLRSLLRDVRASTRLPLIAAGGIMEAADVEAVLAEGAVAAQCGTAFLLADESGTSPVHRSALADPRFTATAVTRAFSGRPARGLANGFMADHPDAPAAYPEVNNATRPIRAAASSAGDAERVSLWAGTGFRRALALPGAEIVRRLSP